MANQPMKVSILIDADASGVKPGAMEANAALDTIGTTANVAGRSIGKFQMAANDASVALGRLTARQAEFGHAMSANTANIAAQFQDIAVTASMGMAPLQVALQQGTQLASALGSAGGGLRGAVSALTAGFGALLSPVSLATIGLTAAAAAAISYFTTAGEGSEDAAASLAKQIDLIEKIAAKWGDALPAVKAYADQIKEAADAADRAAVANAAAAKVWGDAGTTATDFNDQITKSLEFIGKYGDEKKLPGIIDDWNDLKAAIAAHNLTAEQAQAFEKNVEDALTATGKEGADPLIAKLKALIAQLTEAKEKSAEFIQQNAKFGDKQFGPFPGGFEPRLDQKLPVPGQRPNIELEGLEEPKSQKPQLTVYEQLSAASDRRIAELRNEMAIAGQATDVQNRLRAAFQAEADYREQIARDGGTVKPEEIAALRQKAMLLADINQQLAAQKIAQNQQDELRQLQLQASLIGATAQEQARANAVFQVEQQMRQAGIDLLSKEADARRQAAIANADYRSEIERQQAAYQSVQQAGSTMIDQMMVGTGSLKDSLKNVASTLLQTFQQLAIANPLKNALLGTNLPTLADLFSGKPAAPAAGTATGTMTVTAATVIVNGMPIGSLGTNPFAGATAVVPGAANANSPFDGASATISRILPAANQNTPAVTSNTDIAAYIRQAAIERGIDPNTALAVARSEGGLDSRNLQSRYVNPATGLREQSYGPYQLYMNGGLGNQFQQQTGLDPRLAQNGPAGVDFALDYAKEHGWSSWYGARNTGISNWQGINRGQTPAVDPTTTNSISKLSQTATTTAAQVDKMGTGALDASKALTEGNTSLVSSISKASQAAQTPAATPAVTPNVGAGVAGAPATGGLLSQITGTIGNLLGGIGGLIGNIVKGIGSIFSSLFGGLFADGAAFSSGVIVPFANGTVIDKPTLFPMAGGRTGLMGEDGPEAIMPLRRGSDGKLGVVSAMPRAAREGGSMSVSLTTHNTIEIKGTSDAEREAQWQAGTQMMLDQRDRQWRSQLPDMIDDYRRNPNKRTYG